MKRLLSSILIIMALSSASYAAATKTEIIEEEVCHAVAGCWINPKTGECPDCVIETRKIVTEIKEEKESEFDTYAEPAIVEKKKKILDGKQSIKSKFHNKLSTEKENNLNKNTVLEKIYYVDKSFSPKKFLSGAKVAFKTIIQSYAKGEINKIKHLTSYFLYLKILCL